MRKGEDQERAKKKYRRRRTKLEKEEGSQEPREKELDRKMKKGERLGVLIPKKQVGKSSNQKRWGHAFTERRRYHTTGTKESHPQKLKGGGDGGDYTAFS